MAPLPGRRIRRSAVVLLVLSLLAVTAPADEPRLVRRDGGGLALAHLPPVLAEKEVREQLESGLTTTFLFELRTRGLGRRTVGAARVEVRYELWDEEYLVTSRGADGTVVRRRLPSFDVLADWWSEPGLTLTVEVPEDPVWLDLSVIPFSRSEEEDAQAWLSESLAGPSTGKGAAEGASDTAEDGFRPLDRLFQVLLATSIARRSWQRYGWPVDLPTGER